MSKETKNTEGKVIKLKRVLVYAAYNSLRKTAPKDFPTAGEIKETLSTILPALKEHIPVYVDFTTKAEELALKVSMKEIDEDGAKKAVEDLNEEFRKHTTEHGNDVCDIALSAEAFKTFRSQFEREKWGQRWVANLEEYAEVNAAFVEAGK